LVCQFWGVDYDHKMKSQENKNQVTFSFFKDQTFVICILFLPAPGFLLIYLPILRSHLQKLVKNFKG